MQSMLQSAVI